MIKKIGKGSNRCSVTLDGTECEVVFPCRYRVFTVKNEGSSDVAASLYPDIADNDNAVIIHPGECGAISHLHADRKSLYLTGMGTVHITAGYNDFLPFNSGGKGGVTVDDTLTFSGQAADSKAVGDKLRLLQDVVNGVTHRFVTDDTTAYSKSVPVGAKISSVNKVGGMTIKQNDSLMSSPVTALHSTLDGRTVERTQIPDGIIALDGYGNGINDNVYNYIDFETMTYHKCVGVVDLGTLNWAYDNTHVLFRSTDRSLPYVDGKDINRDIICTAYDVEMVGEWYDISEKKIMLKHGTTRVGYYGAIIKDSAYSDAETFKSAMSGVMLYYELAEPVVTDITGLLTSDINILDVMSGGDIVFENENKISVPSEAEYIVSLAEVMAND